MSLWWSLNVMSGSGRDLQQKQQHVPVYRYIKWCISTKLRCLFWEIDKSISQITLQSHTNFFIISCHITITIRTTPRLWFLRRRPISSHVQSICVVVFFSAGTGIRHHRFSQPWQLYLVLGLLEAFFPSNLHLELFPRKSRCKRYPVNLSLLSEAHQRLLFLHQPNVHLSTSQISTKVALLAGYTTSCCRLVVTFMSNLSTPRPSCHGVMPLATL